MLLSIEKVGEGVKFCPRLAISYAFKKKKNSTCHTWKKEKHSFLYELLKELVSADTMI